MKPSLEALQLISGNSFLIRTFAAEEIDSLYHFHPEFELAFITKGAGKRYVGNSMGWYVPGDLVLLGSNLPHCWKTDPVVKGEINTASIVIQFSYDFMGLEFFTKAALSKIGQLLQKSIRGIAYNREANKHIGKKLADIISEPELFKRLLLFLEILDELSGRSDYFFLDNENSLHRCSTYDQERISAALDYIIDNFTNDISLTKAASLSNMTPNAFCRYFKKITRKTFMEVVIDYRLNHATNQLINTGKSVTQICFESGFNDAAHFSRMFKKKMKLTPHQYRTRFEKDLKNF